jgi:hypothetical protein
MQERSWDTIDVLKLDIEGAEKNVFGKDFEKWLPKAKVLIIEFHDRMVEGCSSTVLKALSHYNFRSEVKGENTIFYNKKFI